MKRGVVVILAASVAMSLGLLTQIDVINKLLDAGYLVPRNVIKRSRTDAPPSSVGDAEPAAAEGLQLAALEPTAAPVPMDTTVPMVETSVPAATQPMDETVTGELEATKGFLKVVCEVQSQPRAKNLNFRDFPLDLRERLFSALYAAERKLPLPEFQQTSRPAVQPDCRHPSLEQFLTGQLRSKPVTLVDLPSGMGGGPELDFLELRLMEMQGVADLMVVAESSYSFRADRKPRQFKLNEKRFEAFRDWILYVDFEQCEQYWKGLESVMKSNFRPQAIWSIQNSQRECLWEMFFRARPNLTEETLVIHSDLDEIPNAELMMSLKYCEWKTPAPERLQLNNRVVTFNLRDVLTNEATCFPKQEWRQGGVFQLGWAKKTLASEHHIALRYKTDVPDVKGGSIHLSHFGHALSILTKGLQHGEGGGLLLPPGMNPCHTTDQEISRFLSAVRDDPISIVRSWEHKSNPLKKETPSLLRLQQCHLPWVLLANPQRYAAFWGQPFM